MESLSRRSFLKLSAVSGGGLLVSCSLGPGNAGNQSWQPNAWLEITPDNRIRFILDRVEMGQGSMTGLTTLIAEELNIHPHAIEVVFAPVGKAYVNRILGIQITGESTSLAAAWQPLREAGAAARVALQYAGAEVFGTAPSQVTVKDGMVSILDGKQQLSYGDLGVAAAKQKLPDPIPLKHPRQYRFIGKSHQRLDAVAKVTGTAAYGMDTDLPNMLFAVFIRADQWDSEVAAIDVSAAKAMPGVVDAFMLDKGDAQGVAVVAESYWQARQAQAQVKVTWSPSALAETSDASLFAEYKTALAEQGGQTVRQEGNFEQAAQTAKRTIKAEYQMPFLGHATLEPQNCTAWARGDQLEIWAPTQAPDMAAVAAAKATDYSAEDIRVHTTFIGGGFGRRLMQDYVAEVAAMAEYFKRPVKLIWSREEDTRRDWLRPSSLHQLSATFDSEGKLSGWQHRIAGESVAGYFSRDAGPAKYMGMPKFAYGMISSAAKAGMTMPEDGSIYDGAKELPYAIDNIAVDFVYHKTGLPVGYWRSVGHSHNGFVVETFMDRLAREQNQDPYEFRRTLLRQHPRGLALLQQLAKRVWGRPLAGCTQGLAIHKSFHTWVAQIADVEVKDNGYQVKRVVCAVDCGRVVNPDVVRAQMEGGIIFALTAVKYGEINIVEGAIKQTNFHDYQMLRMPDSPAIEVLLIPSNEAPTGVGEPGVPPLAAAVANAISAKTGQVYTSLPLRL